MELSRFSDYSLRTLMYLAVRGEGELTSLDEISDAYDISKSHLTKVVPKLVKLGYLNTIRGPKGGIELAVKPEHIRIGEVIRGTEKMALVECFEGREGNCCIDGLCELKGILHLASAAFIEILDRYTLADLTSAKSRLKNRLQIS